MPEIIIRYLSQPARKTEFLVGVPSVAFTIEWATVSQPRIRFTSPQNDADAGLAKRSCGRLLKRHRDVASMPLLRSLMQRMKPASDYMIPSASNVWDCSSKQALNLAVGWM